MGAELPLQSLEVHAAAGALNPVNATWKGMIGKELFLRNIFVRMKLSMIQGGSKLAPWAWIPSAQNAGYTQGGPEFYQPQRFRVLLVKLKRDSIPVDSEVFRLAGLAPSDCAKWAPAGQVKNEKQRLVGQSLVNTRLFVGLNHDYFGLPPAIGATGGLPTAWGLPYQSRTGPDGSGTDYVGKQQHDLYFDQPVARKYWDVLSDQRFVIGAKPTRRIFQLTGQDAPATLPAYPFPGTGVTDSNTKSYKVLKFSLPFNQAVEMCGPSGEIPSATGIDKLVPQDLNLHDVKLIVMHAPIHALAVGPEDDQKYGSYDTFTAYPPPPAYIANKTWDKDTGSNCRIDINGMTSYTDS